MHDSKLAWRIDLVLLMLLSLDGLLSFIALAAPQTWFTVFHGTLYLDPEGLLPRTGAAWAGFALAELLAYFKWRSKPYWLVVVVGIRLSDLFTDWTYLAFAQDRTLFAWISLAVASPANAWLASFFLRAYLRVSRYAPRR